MYISTQSSVGISHALHNYDSFLVNINVRAFSLKFKSHVCINHTISFKLIMSAMHLYTEMKVE